ncbi:unnamed protein product [Caenorhabditis brenneri]
MDHRQEQNLTAVTRNISRRTKKQHIKIDDTDNQETSQIDKKPRVQRRASHLLFQNRSTHISRFRNITGRIGKSVDKNRIERVFFYINFESIGLAPELPKK